MSDRAFFPLLGSVVLVVFVWSVIHPKDLFTWFLEVIPAILGVAILILTYHRFQLTRLLYVLIAIHAIILMIGGHYTYAEVPLFNWIRDAFHLARNHYDRLGHFAQGFVPAMISREVLLRTTPLKKGKMLAFLAISICMSISAYYELFEWRVAVATGTAADAFLGSQGDVWDTQNDMAMCFIGAVTAVLTMSGLHDRFLDRIMPRSSPSLENSQSSG
jgi:putative membrane protein